MFLFRVEVLRFFSRALEIKGSRVVLRAISRAILRGEGEGERCRRSSSLETNLGSLNKSRVWFASFEVDAGHRPISELALRLSRWTEYTNQSASSLRVLRVGRTERSSARVDSFVDSTNQSAGFASCKSDAIFASILFSFLLADDSHLFFFSRVIVDSTWRRSPSAVWPPIGCASANRSIRCSARPTNWSGPNSGHFPP